MTALDNVNRAQFDWREQPYGSIQGNPVKLGDVSGGKMYHGSPYVLSPNAIIEPGVKPANHKQSPGDSVSVTSVEWNARRWSQLANQGESHVYEVEPLHPVSIHRDAPADYGKSFQVYEGRTKAARVIREVPSRRA